MTQRIVLATTVDESLQLMEGFPALLVNRGWDVHIVSSGGRNLERLATLPGITTHTVPMKRNPHPLFDLIALCRWYVLLRSLQPDAVSFGTPKASLLGIVAARLIGVPVRQYLLRGLRLETASRAMAPVLRLLERLVILCSTDVISVSSSLMREAERVGAARPGELIVLGRGSSNGVNVHQFDPERFSQLDRVLLAERLGLANGVFTVGFVGRITADKGVAELVAAARILAGRGLEIQLLVIGSGEDAASVRLMHELRAEGIAVTITGYVEDPSPYMALMDVLCLPSHREGLPNVALEAAASALPIVATRATGVVDAVIDEKTGLLCEVGDVKGIANGIEQLARNPAFATRLGTNGREFVRESFDRDLVQAVQADRLLQMASQGSREEREP